MYFTKEDLEKIQNNLYLNEIEDSNTFYWASLVNKLIEDLKKLKEENNEIKKPTDK